MRDRGAIKWSSLMLPEHKKLLENLYQKQNYVEKPIIDQDKSEEINYILVLATKEKRKIIIKIYDNYKVKSIEGTIKKYDSVNNRLTILGKSNTLAYINLNTIVDIILTDN